MKSLLKEPVVRAAVAVAMTMAFSVSAHGGDYPKDSFEGWKARAVSAQNDPRAAGAEQVFARVLAAADKSEARVPRLVVIKDSRDPYAAAMPDGTVVVSMAGIDACYAAVDRQKGDARLAFVLGHELSHLAKNDFWHQTAYRALKEFAPSGGALKDVADVMAKAGDIMEGANREVTKVKELQADSYGIVYMAMAGYDPHAVVDQDGTNFFRDYVRQVTGEIAYRDDSHPTPTERAEFLRSQLTKVVGEVDLFHIGVRFYQQGRHQDALTYFNRFREQFPSREVLNDIGLCYYQLALERLSRCDNRLAYRFKLPVLLDTVTLATALRGEGGEPQSAACLGNDAYRGLIDEAVKHLELAQEKDHLYLPSRVNLASALVMSGDYAKAVAAAESALRIAPGNRDALGVKAVALYLLGVNNGIDASKAALRLLSELSGTSPPSVDALYNMAAIARERGQAGDKQAHLVSFLELENTGAFAAAAQRELGRPVTATFAASLKAAPRSPVPLGDVQELTVQALRGLPRKSFVIGRIESAVYKGRGVLALVRSDRDSGAETVELVETPPAKQITAAAFRKAYGVPRREIPIPTGEVLVYDGFSADVAAGEIRSLTFYNRNGE